MLPSLLSPTNNLVIVVVESVELPLTFKNPIDDDAAVVVEKVLVPRIVNKLTFERLNPPPFIFDVQGVCALVQLNVLPAQEQLAPAVIRLLGVS